MKKSKITVSLLSIIVIFSLIGCTKKEDIKYIKKEPIKKEELKPDINNPEFKEPEIKKQDSKIIPVDKIEFIDVIIPSAKNIMGNYNIEGRFKNNSDKKIKQITYCYLSPDNDKNNIGTYASLEPGKTSPKVIGTACKSGDPKDMILTTIDITFYDENNTLYRFEYDVKTKEYTQIETA